MIKTHIENIAQGLIITMNNEGIDELINILTYVKESRDHYHLVAGNELTLEKEAEVFLIRHVRIEVI
jgi:hypothetical protein